MKTLILRREQRSPALINAFHHSLEGIFSIELKPEGPFCYKMFTVSKFKKKLVLMGTERL